MEMSSVMEMSKICSMEMSSLMEMSKIWSVEMSSTSFVMEFCYLKV